MRILTLFVRHGTTKFPNAIDKLDRLFANNLADVDWKRIIIDNSLQESSVENIDEITTLVGASNSSWEFSAWDRGMEFMKPTILDFDYVHLATSAFQTLYVDYLDRINSATLRLIAGRAAAVGHVDYYNDPVELFGHRSQSWLRSSFVFLPPTELQILGSLVGVVDDGSIFSGDPRAPFRSDAPLSKSYRSNILNWLTADGTNQNTVWHSRFDLTEQTLSYFQAKALAIMNEHALTIRLRSQGCAIVDATWLSNHAASATRGQTKLRAIPNWHTQLSAYNRI